MKVVSQITLICLVALAFCSNGCVVPEHAHSARCGHYYSGGQWYYVAQHVRGPGCGHVFQGGIWITVP